MKLDELARTVKIQQDQRIAAALDSWSTWGIHLLHDRPDVEREATRQGNRELIKLREAGEQRGSDESVGAQQKQGVARVVLVVIRRTDVTTPQQPTVLLRQRLASLRTRRRRLSRLRRLRWILTSRLGNGRVQTGMRTARRGQGGSAGGALRLRWRFGRL